MGNNKIIIGTLFILIGAILLSSQFITSAILSINKNNWSPGTIYNVLNSAGYMLLSLSVLSFLIGFITILFGLKQKN